jgi:hypothetical protein
MSVNRKVTVPVGNGVESVRGVFAMRARPGWVNPEGAFCRSLPAFATRRALGRFSVVTGATGYGSPHKGTWYSIREIRYGMGRSLLECRRTSSPHSKNTIRLRRVGARPHGPNQLVKYRRSSHLVPRTRYRVLWTKYAGRRPSRVGIISRSADPSDSMRSILIGAKGSFTLVVAPDHVAGPG